jgi:hypothetical protein
MRFTIEDKGPVAGLADITQALLSPDGFYENMPLDDLPTPQALMDAAEAVGIGHDAVELALLDASRFSGVTPRRRFGKSATRRLGVWLHLATKEQQQRVKVKVPWFEAHAPRGGQVRARHTTKRARGGKIGLKVFGSTLFQAGRSLEVTAHDDTHSRAVCTRSSVILEGTPTRYHFGDKKSDWELANLAEIEKQDEDLNSCLSCSIRPDQIDRKEYDAAKPLDRMSTANPVSFSKDYAWDRKFGFSVLTPIPVPHGPLLFVNVGFIAATAVTWRFDLTLMGGYRYQEYWRKGTREIPPMWAAEP